MRAASRLGSGVSRNGLTWRTWADAAEPSSSAATAIQTIPAMPRPAAGMTHLSKAAAILNTGFRESTIGERADRRRLFREADKLAVLRAFGRQKTQDQRRDRLRRTQRLRIFARKRLRPHARAHRARVQHIHAHAGAFAFGRIGERQRLECRL